MTNILMNLTCIDQDWCRPVLSRFFHKGTRVTVIPFAFHEEAIDGEEAWMAEYGPGGKQYQEIVPPLRSYGVREKDVSWVNYYTDDPKTFGEKVQRADVVLLPGGWPERLMGRLWEFGAISQLAAFPGVVLGFSAGAMVQFDCFHVTPESEDQEFFYEEGLGMLSAFDIEVHYGDTEVQRVCMARAMEETGRGIFAIEDQGGLLVEGSRLTTFGAVHYFAPTSWAQGE